MVGVFYVAAGGKTLGNATDLDVFLLQLANEIEGGCFTFNTGVEGDDDFLDGLIVYAVEKRLDVKLIWANAVHRADNATKNVIKATVGATVLNGVDVAGFFDNANLMGIALIAFANWAKRFVSEVKAALAVVDTVAAVINGAREAVA